MLQFRIRPSANREVGVNWRPNDRTMAQDVERESQGERERASGKRCNNSDSVTKGDNAIQSA